MKTIEKIAACILLPIILVLDGAGIGYVAGRAIHKSNQEKVSQEQLIEKMHQDYLRLGDINDSIYNSVSQEEQLIEKMHQQYLNSGDINDAEYNSFSGMDGTSGL